MKLSIVTTVYRSTPYLEQFHRRMSAVVNAITDNYEVIYVNDGCPEGSLAGVLDLRDRDPRVAVLDLSTNFGQHKAIMTGLEKSRGELIFLIDVDLEEPPELLQSFYLELQSQNADVVYGVQKARQGSWFKRTTGQLFYHLFECLSSYPVPSNPLNARLMTRRYVKSLLLHREREPYLAGLWAITGYKQIPVTVLKGSRGSSSYTLLRRLKVVLNALLSFSDRPLIHIFLIGLAIFSIAAAAASWLVISAIATGNMLPGWTSLIVSVWLLGGLTLCCLGVMSLYLSRIFIETKQRPYTIIRQEYPSAVSQAGSSAQAPESAATAA